jgi:hypothetical protein
MNLKLLIILTLTAGLSWWLSGFDSNVTGENKRSDFARRAFRCGITLLLVGIGSSSLLSGGVIFFIITLPLAFVWAGCLSELFSRGFHALVDSSDQREIDPHQVSRELDRVGGLVQEGRYEEALATASRLTESGEGSSLALETALARLYGDMFDDQHLANSPALIEVQHLWEQRRLDEVEAKLKSLLDQQPLNLCAAMMLLRLYAQELAQPDKATALLEVLRSRPRLPPGFIDHARRALDEWCGKVLARPKTPEGIESLLVTEKPSPRLPGNPPAQADASIDELLSSGYLATAIEILENEVRANPGDFGPWLKLAEAHGFYCANLSLAAKVVDQIVANPGFDHQQKQLAKAKLGEWRKRSP